MKPKLILIGCFLIGFVNNNLFAEAKDSVQPKQQREVRLQYAGNLGFISIGFGREFTHPRIALGVSYGYLSKQVHGVKVHTFAFKSTFKIWKIYAFKTEINQYVGSSITYSIAHKTYSEYPTYFPYHYHIPNALHLNPLVGLRVDCRNKEKIISNISLFAEVGTVDTLIWYEITNKNIEFDDIVNLSFGVAIGI